MVAALFYCTVTGQSTLHTEKKQPTIRFSVFKLHRAVLCSSALCFVMIKTLSVAQKWSVPTKGSNETPLIRRRSFVYTDLFFLLFLLRTFFRKVTLTQQVRVRRLIMKIFQKDTTLSFILFSSLEVFST